MLTKQDSSKFLPDGYGRLCKQTELCMQIVFEKASKEYLKKQKRPFKHDIAKLY